MRRAHLSVVWIAVAGLAMLAGCGGVVLGTIKYMPNPLGLQDRSASASTTVTVSGLTTRITANQQSALQFDLSDQTVSGNSYEGMSQMTISQQAMLTFAITPSSAQPNTIILRDVSLVVVVHISEGNQTFAPVEFRYTGFLTLDWQPNGTYKARENLTFAESLDRFDGSTLITMLTSRGTNTVTTDISFSAETSSPNIPEGSSVTMTLQFGEGTATIRW